MNLRQAAKNIDKLSENCKAFLELSSISDEQKKSLDAPHGTLHIKAFNNIINDCKEEVKRSNDKKIISVLKLLYNIKAEPFDYHILSDALNNFVNKQLKSSSEKTSEEELRSMIKIVDNIKIIQGILNLEVKKLKKEAQSFYVINKFSRKKIAKYNLVLNELKAQICTQLEYEAKIIVKNIIEDFYNTYIFFSHFIRLCVEKNQYLLSIEVANAIDRYINIVKLTFNGRQLKHQDMLYYYLIHELNDLKDHIYENIDEDAVKP